MQMFIPHLKKGKKLKPQDIVVFPWETVSKEVIDRKQRLREKALESKAFFEKMDQLKADGKIVKNGKKVDLEYFENK